MSFGVKKELTIIYRGVILLVSFVFNQYGGAILLVSFGVKSEIYDTIRRCHIDSIIWCLLCQDIQRCHLTSVIWTESTKIYRGVILLVS